MESVLAAAAAATASAFCGVLVASHLRRPRPHAAVWSVAMGMYALATWALAWGLAGGWSGATFRVFFLFGAILNVMFLALGAVYLVAGPRTGAVLLIAFSAFGAGASAVTLTAPFASDLPRGGVPAGSEVFAGLGEGLASPRLWAVVGNSVGTALLVGFALATVARTGRRNRDMAVGNALIVGGAVAPALGGSMTGLGRGGTLTVSLLVGAALLWAGYAIAGGARRGSAGVPRVRRARRRRG
jgi:hypothetical protein